MSDRSSDLPLDRPDQDLLGIARHAEVLANTVRTVSTPFTIGVYGEWGAGKTTFVNFVRYYLDGKAASADSAPAFVHFEGWQHRTADELWRALMIDIARAVYKKKHGDKFVETTAPPTNGKNGANGERSLRAILAEDAVVIRRAAREQTPNDDFRDLVLRLDSTMYGGISKRSQEGARLDQDQAMLSAVKASVAALGVMSPMIAALKGLFGFEDKIDVSNLFQREQNENTRQRIESKREFQQTLTDLLKVMPAECRICVFLDDLDRCMPDVVLDLLDAIKIFLDVPGVVFVVAADETLIGKGLRLRFKEMLEANTTETEKEFLARKGQEYFEKIIQLRINLPECTPQNGHRYITAQFPEWMPATDIILAAVGTNPRRIKQYCSWLAFRRNVDHARSGLV
jgi:hypothetical protein